MTASPADTADRIVADLNAHAPFEGYAEAVGASLEAAYALQDAVVARLERDAARGPVAGYKLAANSAKALAGLGLAEPLSARLFAAQCLQSPADLRGHSFRTRAFEPEIAAVIGSDVPAGPQDRASILPHVARLIPAFEVLDMREAKPSPATMPLAVAQNISNEGAVLGGPGLPPSEVDVEALRLRVRFGEAELADVVGGAPQHPLDAVAWLAGHLAARGLLLRAGMVVLCGTHTPILFPEGAGRLALEIDGLGTAAVELY